MSPLLVDVPAFPWMSPLFDYTLENDSTAAMKSAYQVFKSDPAHAGENTETGMNQLGWKYLSQNQAPEAVALFELNAVSNPASWRVNSSLGAAYMKVDENKKAIEVLQRSLELNPKNVVAKGRLVTLGAIEADE